MMKAASSLNNTITSDIADGGVHEDVSAAGISALFAGVSMISGITQNTPIPSLRNSAAMLSVNRITAPLAAAYALMQA